MHSLAASGWIWRRLSRILNWWRWLAVMPCQNRYSISFGKPHGMKPSPSASRVMAEFLH